MNQNKTIPNSWLTLTVLFILLVTLSVIYRSMLANKYGENWEQMQKQNLPSELSGQTNARQAQLKAKNLHGKYIKLPILMYHHIGDVPKGAENDQLRKGLTVSEKSFDEQMAWLKAAGYSSITLKNLLDYTNGEFEMPKNPVIITLDDGYQDAILNAPPILKKYGFVGSFAIITQFSGIKYGTNRYATWQEIKQAKNQGMEIVSHTQDHFDGTDPKYEDAFILRNLSLSRQDIKDNLGIDTQILIYPFGHYDDRYIKLAKEAGFLMGVAINDHKTISLDKLFEVPRLRVNGNTTIVGFKKMLLE
jgi:peptidoglycan/xylan/chitin deacetylase (PgdA/CDA1 family)